MIDVLVAPVSGGSFVNQVACYFNLLEHNYKPDVSMGASGGIISLILLLISDSTPNGLVEVSSKLNSEMFKKKWYNTIPPAFMLLLKGSMYQHSKCHKLFFENTGSNDMFSNHEIWFNTFNMSRKRNSLFSVCEKDKCKLFPSNCKLFLTDVEYLNGDIDLITDGVLASCAVPTIIPDVVFMGENHCDGGLGFPSPLILLKDSIYKSYKKNKVPFHIILASSQDLDSIYISECKNIAEKTRDIFNILTNCPMLIERQSTIDLLHKIKENKKVYKIKEENLDHYFKNKHLWRGSVLESYSVDNINVDLFRDFKGDEIFCKILESSNKLKYRLWYVEL